MFRNIIAVTIFITCMIVTFASNEECKDLYHQCGGMNCDDPITEVLCAKTCGVCGTTPSTTIASDCNDMLDQCNNKFCMDPMAKKLCAKTCGFCATTPSSTTAPACKNLFDKCDDMDCSSSLAKELCAKTCKFCDDDSTSTPLPDECNCLCRLLQPLCKFIEWFNGSFPDGFCYRCQKCK